jgi:hypothetical protein
MGNDFNDQANLAATLANIRAAGGGSALSEMEVKILMSHEAYTNGRHLLHQELSKVVCENFQARFPEKPGDLA